MIARIDVCFNILSLISVQFEILYCQLQLLLWRMKQYSEKNKTKPTQPITKIIKRKYKNVFGLISIICQKINQSQTLEIFRLFE